MRKSRWMFGIWMVLVCAMAIMMHPVQTEAASQSDKNAYRTVFDASYYYSAYPDVAAACGTDEEALFNHFVNFGVYEGRSCSAEFNPQAYRQRYADLQEAFGSDMAAYCRHYVTFGRAEGRNACADGQAAVTITVNIQKKTTPAAQKEEVGKGAAAEEESVVTENTQETKKETTEEKNTNTENTEETKITKTTVQEDAAVEDTEKESATAEENVKENAAKENAAAEEADVVSVASEQKSQTAAQSVIGTYTTTYDANIQRATNVELAAQRINGIVVQPGDNFSFSNTILDRTTANGYVEGPIFVKGKESTGIGGGVCQVSSTLYAAMLEANLPATERHAHSMPVDYLPQGMDATIAGDYLDLKFVNSFSQPLLIQASAQNGTLTVTLILE